jgi:hypothetical protein
LGLLVKIRKQKRKLMARKFRGKMRNDRVAVALIQRRHQHDVKAQFAQDIGDIGGINADAAGFAAESGFGRDQDIVPSKRLQNVDRRLQAVKRFVR